VNVVEWEVSIPAVQGVVGSVAHMTLCYDIRLCFQNLIWEPC